MYPADLPVTTLERIKGMIAMRDCVHELMLLQRQGMSGEPPIPC